MNYFYTTLRFPKWI